LRITNDELRRDTTVALGNGRDSFGHVIYSLYGDR
jgi:hypothetical protein